jgi:class 3 adenylate cyclase
MEAVSGSEARAQREFIKGVFSHHVAPEVVEQIINDPAKMTSLEGERRTMTFLFTDVADFTTMSEHVESKELARVVNAYLEGMTEIVQKHGGMVDKFIGDAVFAIFNAPIDLPDHATAAVKCALEMDRFCCGFSREQKARNIPFGHTRIGIHTGTAVVGNFGSRRRHNYTASGDAVNTASRLEGLNKHFGTRLSVSGATRSLCADIRFRPTASVVLKGKTNAIEVWDPLRDAGGDGFVGRYCDAYELLRGGGRDAKALFEALAREVPDDPCVAFHLGRIRQGVSGIAVTMTEK